MKYNVYGSVVISVYTVVEADNEDEARKIAEVRDACSIGDPRSYGDRADQVWFHSGEIDGIPEVDNVEVADD